MNFRCPHCRQKTITAWSKLKTRGACPGWQGRFVGGSWELLLASLAVPFTMFAPFLLLRPPALPPFWLLLAIGAMLTLPLFVTIHLFATPLYRKGSVAARWDAITFLTFLAVVIVVAIMNTDFSREAGLSSEEFSIFLPLAFGIWRAGAMLAKRDHADRRRLHAGASRHISARRELSCTFHFVRKSGKDSTFTTKTTFSLAAASSEKFHSGFFG